MTEAEFRAAIVAEAKSWIGTPWQASGTLKGVGVNCAQYLFGVASLAQVLPPDAPAPRWYTPQLAMNSREERLVAYVEAYGAREISEAQVGPGDIVLYRNGKAHGHAAIVVEWPRIVHVMPIHGCQMGEMNEGRLAALGRRYFTLWSAPRLD